MILKTLLVMGLLLVLGCCAACGSGQDGQRLAETARTTISAGLPSLPDAAEAGPVRRSSNAELLQDGSTAFRHGTNVQISGSLAQFFAAPGALAYSIYEFDVPVTRQLLHASYTVSTRSSGAQVWLALSNYDSGRWDIIGSADADSQSFELSAAAGTYSNAAGKLYVAVIGFDSLSWDLEEVSIQIGPYPLNGWAHTWGLSGSDGVGGLAVDSDENVYVCGQLSTGTDAPSNKLGIVKFDKDGNKLASKSYYLNSLDALFGTQRGLLTADSNGNLLICGQTVDESNEQHTVVLKLGPALNLLWQKSFSAQSLDVINEISVDGSGSLACAGFTDDGLDRDGLLLWIAADGSLSWSKRWASPDTNCELTHVDASSGDVFACGLTGMNNDYDFCTVLSVLSVDESLGLKQEFQPTQGEEPAAIRAVGPFAILTVPWTDPDSQQKQLGFVPIQISDGTVFIESALSVPGATLLPISGLGFVPTPNGTGALFARLGGSDPAFQGTVRIELDNNFIPTGYTLFGWDYTKLAYDATGTIIYSAGPALKDDYALTWEPHTDLPALGFIDFTGDGYGESTDSLEDISGTWADANGVLADEPGRLDGEPDSQLDTDYLCVKSVLQP